MTTHNVVNKTTRAKMRPNAKANQTTRFPFTQQAANTAKHRTYICDNKHTQNVNLCMRTTLKIAQSMPPRRASGLMSQSYQHHFFATPIARKIASRSSATRIGRFAIKPCGASASFVGDFVAASLFFIPV